MRAPESFEQIVDLLVPELQKRGRYKKEYAPGSLREKLDASSPRLAPPHPATSVRRHWNHQRTGI